MKPRLMAMLLGILLGAAVTAGLFWGISSPKTEPDTKAHPLYWVAPMDSNYRRDRPGKSPMGMDLIPVYADDTTKKDNPGAIYISPDVENNLGVRTANAAFRHLNNTIHTVGYVQYDEDRLVHIHPRVEGWVEQLYVKAAGDPVKQGEPLYSLYSPDLVNAQEEFLLALRQENHHLHQAAENRLRALQLDNVVIEHLKKHKEVLQTVIFRAPQSGVIDNLNIREGFFVEPGTTMMSLGNLDRVWVEADVFERQASLIHTGTPVSMQLDYLPNRRWQGKVHYVYPALNPETRTLRVRLQFDNTDGQLKPNMFAQVALYVPDSKPRLMIPSEAIIRTQTQERVVLALGNGRFKSIAITTGRRDRTHTQVLSGLKAGESIVVSAQFLLDSESSKTSDFKRLDHPSKAQAEVQGVIQRIDHTQRTITILREAIKKWRRPAATVTFSVVSGISLNKLQVDQSVYFRFSVNKGAFLIDRLHVVKKEKQKNDLNRSSTMEHRPGGSA